jgi:hypothetical protein
MPFTFSHPAIVLPLRYLPSKWFSLTGLIIGSLTPDFEYFLRMKVQSIYSHTLPGIFWFDLPLGILLTFLFHNLVRNSLFKNLPFELKSRFEIFREFNWNLYFKNNWVIITISIILGIASHLFWDSFTHETGYFVKVLPALQDSVILFDKNIKFFKILQHGSTILGALVISLAIYKMPKLKTENGKVNFRYWIILSIITFIIIVLKIILKMKFCFDGNFIVSLISAFLLSLIITPFFILTKNNGS